MNNTSLGYSFYDFENVGYMKPPAPPINAGLFSGEPFKSNSHWSNINITPDADYYIEKGLDHGKRVPNSQFQYIHYTRLGNNLAPQQNLKPVDPSKYTIKCGAYTTSPCLCTNHCSCAQCMTVVQ